MLIAEQLVANFGRIAAADGGRIEVIAADGDRISIGYHSPVIAAECADGVCSLPHAELEAMMLAWLARKAPEMKLEVRPLQE